ncbi:Camkk2 [Symbiodinium sp. CCMP2592]|nr:Camkk2 [Symbiodinium sp. CCMP2592]
MAVVREAEAERDVREAEAPAERAGQRQAVQRERVVRAIVLPCGPHGSFKGEVYQYTTPVAARDGHSRPGFFFWVFRWMIDFLGGVGIANMAGRSREPIANRTAAVIFDGLSSSDEEVQKMGEEAKEEDEEAIALPVADDHLTSSSMMAKQVAVSARKRKAAANDEDVREDVGDREAEEEEEDEPLSRGDFSLSSFACICWLGQLMARAEGILQGMRDTFWQDVRKGCFQIVRGEVSVQSLVKEHGQIAAKIFNKQEQVEVVEALRILQADAVRRSLSQDRRRAAEKLFARFVRSLAESIDDTVGKPLWTEAILDAGGQAGPSIAGVFVAQSHFASGSGAAETKRNRERPSKFLEAERLSYVAAGRSVLAQAPVLSVVADAVHVGQEDWLNVFLCDTSEDVKKGTAITSDDWTDMWQGRITKSFKKAGSKGRSPPKTTGGYKEPERLATQEWFRDMSHSLAVVGWGFSSFRRTSEAGRPRVLILCTDQEATQLAAVNYLKFGRSLFVEHVNDPAHRSHNDVNLAMAAAGLLTFGLVSIGLYNVRYGPWNKGTWFGKVQTMADEMSRSMSPSDPLLLTFFPDILEDQGRSQEDNNEAERRAFLESLPNRSFVRSKGSKASQSRFNSLSQAHAELDGDWSACCLVLVALCVAEGWCTTASQLWSPSAGMAETTTAATTRAAAKSNVRCSTMLADLRAAEATVSQYANWAHWQYMEVAREHVAKLSNLAALKRIGLDMSFELPKEEVREDSLAWQDAVAHRVVRLTHRLLRYRCGSQLGPRGRWRRSSLDGHSATAPVMAMLLSELREASFVEVPPGTFEWLRRSWSGLLNSKLVEDANKVQREAEQRNGTSKMLGRLEGWHGLSRKKLLEQYHRREVPSGRMATVLVKFEADPWFVRPQRLRTDPGSSSAAVREEQEEGLTDQTFEDDLLKGVSQARTWASPTPESEQDKLAGFSLLTKVVRQNMDWSFVEKGWWAALAPEGHALQFPTGPPLYVVRSYKRASPAGDIVRLDLENPHVGWVHLFDEAVDVLDLAATSPQRGLVSLGETRAMGVVFRVQARCSLLQHHEKFGFAGVPEWGLRRLAEVKGWPAEAEDEEDDRLAVVCLLSLQPTLTKDDVVNRLLFRQDVASWSGEFGELDLTEVVRDTMLAADQDVALQQLAKRKAARETAVEIRKRVSRTFEAVAKTFASRPEYKKAAAARKAKEKQASQQQKDHAAAIKRCYAALSDKVAKVGVPTAVRVYRDDYNGRWRLTYRTVWAQVTRSISWTAVGSRNAAAEAVRQGWQWAETFDGLPMPEEAAGLLQKLAA